MTSPSPDPVTRLHPVNGIDLAVHEWSGPPGAVPIVFAHATGFHGRVFGALIAQLADHPSYAIDLRGHGRSGGGPIDDWRVPARDIAMWLEQQSIGGAIGVGHSMGAHLLLQVAADRPEAFTRLVLFDPVILPPEIYAHPAAPSTPENRHPTARRKRDFASVEAMMERFRDRDPYGLFDPQVFADYCRHGLVPAASGEGFELACAPETEASVYESSRSNPGILDAAKRVAIPVLVVRAMRTNLFDFKGSPTWPGLAGILSQGRDLDRPDMTHFHPLQDPADAARIIREWIA
jgi:pimeloyl-ACP methyl ester carboxylesterase